jgi:hypothetical protein
MKKEGLQGFDFPYWDADYLLFPIKKASVAGVTSKRPEPEPLTGSPSLA